MISRRAMIRGLAGGLAAGLLPRRAWGTPPGCSGVTLGGDALEGLRASLGGELLVRNAAGYAQACAVYNQRFGAQPLMVVRPQSESDIAAAIRYATSQGVPWAVKSGGHSYIGASSTSGMLIDLSTLGGVEPAGSGLVRIGPGAPLKRVYSRLACDGLTLPCGTCDTVGFGGIALGGGVGYLMRQHGLTIDRVRSMRVVLADGRAVTVSEDSEPDLFWALRGCGGGNFGVVTEFQVEPVALQTLQAVAWTWPWDAAEAAFARWQQVLAQGALPRHAVAYASFQAPAGRLAPRLIAGVISSANTQAVRDAADLFVGTAGVASQGATSTWTLTTPACGAVESPSASRYKSKSAMLFAPMAPGGVRTICAAMERHRADPSLPLNNEASLTFLSLGGAVADIAPDATAFPHRHAIADAQYLAYWPQMDASTADANLAWMRATYAETFPAISAGGSGCYVNYCDDELAATEWPSLYYGANLPRLRSVKRSYDPQDLFNGPQSIRPVA